MPRLITLNCPSCKAKNAVNEDDAGYTCQFCGKEHTLNAQTPVKETPATPRAAIEQPADVYLELDGQSIRLVRRWFHKGLLPMAFFCLLWDGFLLFWYWGALRGGAPVAMLLAPIVHVIAGVVLTCGLIAGLVNRTEITFDRRQLSVWHGPLPWWGNRRLPLSEVRQLYTKASNIKKNGRPTYHLFYVTRDGRSKKLLSGLDAAETALFIEQQIEGWLNIPDQPVQGEVSR